jgi:hypothetical protein
VRRAGTGSAGQVGLSRLWIFYVLVSPSRALFYTDNSRSLRMW